MQSPDTVSRPVRRRVEVGGSVHSVVELLDDHVVVRLVGEFSRSTAPAVRRTLVRLLRGGEPVLADLSGLAAGWPRAVEVFPSASEAVGG